MFGKLALLAAIAAASLSTGLAQTQNPPTFVRDYCVKVEPGKAAEYREFLQILAKINRARVDAGEMQWWVVAHAVVPAGTSAKCDYHSYYGYSGFPAETPTPTQTEAALKRAGLNITVNELEARRDASSHLANVEIWVSVDTAGDAAVEKGNYLVLNHNKMKDDQYERWAEMERTGWKPIVDAYSKAGHSAGWSSWLLGLPGGSSLPYDSMTVDRFPDWASYGRGIPVAELWPKVHPDQSFYEYMDRYSKIADRHSVEVYQVDEVTPPK